jgi:hypothetical protein
MRAVSSFGDARMKRGLIRSALCAILAVSVQHGSVYGMERLDDRNDGVCEKVAANCEEVSKKLPADINEMCSVLNCGLGFCATEVDNDPTYWFTALKRAGESIRFFRSKEGIPHVKMIESCLYHVALFFENILSSCKHENYDHKLKEIFLELLGLYPALLGTYINKDSGSIVDEEAVEWVKWVESTVEELREFLGSAEPFKSLHGAIPIFNTVAGICREQMDWLD